MKTESDNVNIISDLAYENMYLNEHIDKLISENRKLCSKRTIDWKNILSYKWLGAGLFAAASGFVIYDKFFKQGKDSNEKKDTTFYMVKNEDENSSSSLINVNLFGNGQSEKKKSLTQRFREFMNNVNETDDITIVIKTLGGSYSSNKMMTDWICQHKGKVTVIVPEYAFSSGSFVAFYADEIIMHRRAHLSPIDPQLSISILGAFSCMDIMRVFERSETPSEPLQLLHETVSSMNTYMAECFEDRNNFLKPSLLDVNKRDAFYKKLTETYTHSTPLSVDNLCDFGLKITVWDTIPKDMMKKYEKKSS